MHRVCTPRTQRPCCCTVPITFRLTIRAHAPCPRSTHALSVLGGSIGRRYTMSRAHPLAAPAGKPSWLSVGRRPIANGAPRATMACSPTTMASTRGRPTTVSWTSTDNISDRPLKRQRSCAHEPFEASNSVSWARSPRAIARAVCASRDGPRWTRGGASATKGPASALGLFRFRLVFPPLIPRPPPRVVCMIVALLITYVYRFVVAPYTRAHATMHCIHSCGLKFPRRCSPSVQL